MAVIKYFPESDETQRGQRQQSKQGVQSTKELDEVQDTHVVHMPQLWLQEICINIEDMKHLMYTDQTGKFPVVSSQGHRYIMVQCKTYGTFILVEPMKNRTLGEMCNCNGCTEVALK